MSRAGVREVKPHHASIRAAQRRVGRRLEELAVVAAELVLSGEGGGDELLAACACDCERAVLLVKSEMVLLFRSGVLRDAEVLESWWAVRELALMDVVGRCRVSGHGVERLMEAGAVAPLPDAVKVSRLERARDAALLAEREVAELQELLDWARGVRGESGTGEGASGWAELFARSREENPGLRAEVVDDCPTCDGPSVRWYYED